MFTSPVLLPLVAHLLEGFGALDKLEQFVSSNGRKFYGVEASEQNAHVVIERVPAGDEVHSVFAVDDLAVVPFMAGKKIGWRIKASNS